MADQIKNKKYGVFTPVMRTSYTFLTKPDTKFAGTKTDDGKERNPNYKATFLIPVEDKKKLDDLKRACLALAREVWPAIKFAELTTPIKNSEDYDDKWLEKRPNLKGQIFFEAKTGAEYAPALVVTGGKGKDPMKDLSDEIKKKVNFDNAGYYAVAQMTLKLYERSVPIKVKDASGKIINTTEDIKGVAFYLTSVMWVKDAERFGKQHDAVEDYKGFDFGDDIEPDDIMGLSAEDSADALDSSDDDLDEGIDEGLEEEAPKATKAAPAKKSSKKAAKKEEAPAKEEEEEDFDDIEFE